MLLRIAIALMTLSSFMVISSGLQPEAQPHLLAWSPVGAWLAVLRDSHVDLVHGDTLDLAHQLAWAESPRTAPVWSSDGESLAVFGQSGIAIWRTPWDEASAQLVQTLRFEDYPDAPPIIHAMTWSPDDAFIAVTIGSTVSIFHVATGSVRDIYTEDFGMANLDVLWTQQERITVASGAAILNYTPEPFAYVNSYYRTIYATGITPYFSSLAFAPDLRYLAAGTTDGLVMIWDADTPDFAESVDPPDRWSSERHLWGIRDIAWSDDGQYIATASEDGSIGVWDASTLSRRGVLFVGPHSDVLSIAFRPSTSHLTYISATGVIEMVEASAIPNTLSPEEARFLDEHCDVTVAQSTPIHAWPSVSEAPYNRDDGEPYQPPQRGQLETNTTVRADARYRVEQSSSDWFLVAGGWIDGENLLLAEDCDRIPRAYYFDIFQFIERTCEVKARQQTPVYGIPTKDGEQISSFPSESTLWVDTQTVEASGERWLRLDGLRMQEAGWVRDGDVDEAFRCSLELPSLPIELFLNAVG